MGGQTLRTVVACAVALCLAPAAPSGAVEPAAAYEGFPVLRGPWLGQAPPGDEAVPFAPGIIKPPGGFHSSVVFSPAGDEACWTSMGAVTYLSRIQDGVWSRPEVVTWEPEYGVGESFFAPSGDRVFFLTRRPPPGELGERERIWFVDREAGGWSAPHPIDATVSDHPTHWSFSLSQAGNLYFCSELVGVRGASDIMVAARTADGYLAPRDLGTAVNSDEREFCPFVAPDESYLVFARKVPEQDGRSDLFVSFRTLDGGWTTAENLGSAVNSRHNETCPAVTPDGRSLVFARISSELNGVYWVSTRVIDRLRPH